MTYIYLLYQFNVFVLLLGRFLGINTLCGIAFPCTFHHTLKLILFLLYFRSIVSLFDLSCIKKTIIPHRSPRHEYVNMVSIYQPAIYEIYTLQKHGNQIEGYSVLHNLQRPICLQSYINLSNLTSLVLYKRKIR